MSPRILASFFAVFLIGTGCQKSPEPEEHGEEADAHSDEEVGAHEELIKLTPEAQKNAELARGKAVLKPLTEGLAVPARIAFPQQAVAQVAARVQGRLTGIEVGLGEKVQKGDVLGYLESPELGQARADFLSAATRTRVTEANFLREKGLLAKGITSEREMRQAEAEFVSAQADMNAAEGRLHALGLNDTDIRALKRDEHYSSRFPARSPIDGTVVEISAMIGQTVEPTTSLFTVGDLRELWAVLEVSESQLADVRAGQSVVLTVSAFRNRQFEGRVSYVGDVVQERTRTIPVRVLVPNEEGLLKPGMFAQAEVLAQVPGSDSGSGPERLVVPREAVQKVGEGQWVFVPAGENAFKPVQVKTGASTAEEVEILSGLEPGSEVITTGAFILKSELSKESLGGGHSH